jgi:hypothetical protein
MNNNMCDGSCDINHVNVNGSEQFSPKWKFQITWYIELMNNLIPDFVRMK